MICNRCGKNLNEGARFCDGCGEQINLVNNQNLNQSNTSANTGLAFSGATNNKSNGNMKKIIIIAAIIIVAVFFLTKIFGSRNNSNSNVVNNSSNNGTSVATIDYSDAMNNPDKYQKYENKIITIEHVFVWNTDDEIILGKLGFGVICKNEDSLNTDGLEDRDYVTIKGQLSRVSSISFTMNSCTLTKE